MTIINNVTDTWNNAGTTFTAIKMSVTNTASAAASRLIDLLVGGTTEFAVGKDGQVLSGHTAVNAPSYSFVGDTDTGWGYRGSDTISAIVGGAEAVRFDASIVTLLSGVDLYLNGGFIDIDEISTPANPSANVARFYAKDSSGTTKLYFRDSAGTETELGAGGGGGALAVDMTFFPADNEPPTSSFATLDTRNSHPVLDFDDTTAEAAIFTGVLSSGYGGAGITVSVGHSATSATSGTIGWTVEIERIGDSQQDVDADGFASAQTITAATVPGTSGHVDVVSANIANGANMDSLAAGEMFRIRIKRDVANDNAVGDAELHWVRVVEQ